jgi:hypothetical protein
MTGERIILGSFAGLFILLNQPVALRAQFCPPGSTQMQNGYAITCQCPDGSLAGYQGCASATPPPSNCPAGSSYCANSGACCGSGLYCSKYGCTPLGAVDCGTGFCNPGQVCTSNGRCMPAGESECGDHSCKPGSYCGSRHTCMQNGTADCGNGSTCPAGNKCTRDRAHCISQDMVDCGSHFCGPGLRCGSGNQCLAASATDCGNGMACSPGQKCSWSSRVCVPQDAIDCGNHACAAGFQCGANNECIPKNSIDCGHGHYCAAGMACGSEFQCMARNGIDCGGGRSCAAGHICVKDGLECLTPAELAQQRTLERRLDQEANTQFKEDKAYEAWLKDQQARLAEQTQKKPTQIERGNNPISAKENVPVTIIPGRGEAANVQGNSNSEARSNNQPPPEPAVMSTIGSAAPTAKLVTIGTPTDIATVWSPSASRGGGPSASGHAYTFTTTPYGTVQIADNGKYIGTTSPSLAALEYGYSNPTFVTNSGQLPPQSAGADRLQQIVNTPLQLTQFYQNNPLASAAVNATASAGGDVAKLTFPAEAKWFTRLGVAGEVGSVGALILQKNYSAIPSNLTEFAGSNLASSATGSMFGAAAAPYGGFVFVASYELGQAYVAPKVAPGIGAWLYNQDPAFWIPTQHPGGSNIPSTIWTPIGNSASPKSTTFPSLVP